MATDIDTLVSAVDEDWIVERARELVEVESETMDEPEVCALFERQMRGLRLEVDVREVTPGRNNLYARIPGSGRGPSLLFNGHLDTIAVGGCPPCRLEGDRLYGRGSTDMKGGMASMLGAAKALRDSGAGLAGDAVLTAVVGHEEPEAGKDGPRALIDDLNGGRVSGDRILIVEGSDELWAMSMGSMVFTIELSSPLGGRHTQYVDFADNPIRHMGELIAAVERLQQELDRGRTHPLAGSERIDLGIAEAGDYFNRTPLRCRLTGTRRWMSGRGAAEVLAELEALARPYAEAGGLGLRVTMEHEREPFETPRGRPGGRCGGRGPPAGDRNRRGAGGPAHRRRRQPLCRRQRNTDLLLRALQRHGARRRRVGVGAQARRRRQGVRGRGRPLLRAGLNRAG